MQRLVMLALVSLAVSCGGDMVMDETADFSMPPRGDMPAPAAMPDLTGASPDLTGEAGPDLGSTTGPGPDLSVTGDLLGVPTCSNHVRDLDETDVDCGGVCPVCAVGKMCMKNSDCQTNLCLNLTCSMKAMAKLTFGAPKAYKVGKVPLFVATGDFNGDKKLDLVTPNAGTFGQTSDVSVLLGNGDGTFAAAVAYASGFNPAYACTGDWNGDKHDDLAVVNQGNGMPGSGSQATLLANNNGTFQNAVSSAIAGGPAANAAGDVNGDGKLDLVVLSSGQGKPGTAFVYLGVGNGTFGQPGTFTVGSSPAELALADFDGDGKLDAMTANGGDFSGPSLLGLSLNTGNGTFGAMQKILSGPGTTHVAAADLNGDGKKDVVTFATINNAPNLVSLISAGNGTFAQPVARVLNGSDYKGIALADYDNDGKIDVAAIFASGTVNVYRGNGDGSFQAEVGFMATANLAGIAIAAGDFNGDGLIDVAVVDLTAASVQVLLNTSM